MSIMLELSSGLREKYLKHLGVKISRFPYERCPEQEKIDWEELAQKILSEDDNPSADKVVSFHCVNWRGEGAIRIAYLIEIGWGSTEWHPQEGWLIKGYDLERKALRQYSLKDCNFRR